MTPRREMMVSGIDQAVEDTAGGGVEGEGHLVSGDGVGDVEPIGAQTDRNGIGLSLQTPAEVVGGPGKGEEAPRGGVDDRDGSAADDGGNPERSVRGESVGVPSQSLAGAGGGERCESAAIAVRAKEFEGVRGGNGPRQVGQSEPASITDAGEAANKVVGARGDVQFHDREAGKA